MSDVVVSCMECGIENELDDASMARDLAERHQEEKGHEVYVDEWD